MRQTGPAGRALIERNEGCRLKAYRDVVGVLTIGYGITGPEVHEGMVITREQADRMLSDRLAREFEPAVNKLIGEAPTTQGQFDAMVSLAFNIGPGDWRRGLRARHDAGGFEDSSVLREHLAGNHQAAANAFLLWNKAGGRVLPALTRRRHQERALYLSEDTETGEIAASAPYPGPLPAGGEREGPAQREGEGQLDPPWLAAVLALEDPEKRLIQEALRARKLYRLAIDGDIGRGTRAALKAHRAAP
jgi:lysozyme